MSEESNNKGGRPLKFKTVEELDKKIDEYFASCWTKKIDMWGNFIYEKDKRGKKDYTKPVMVQKKPYTMSGLALAIGCDRQTLLNYKKDMRYFGSIKRALLACQSYAEEALFVGKNPSGAIFNLKNNYGDWKDKTEVENTIQPGVIPDDIRKMIDKVYGAKRNKPNGKTGA